MISSLTSPVGLRVVHITPMWKVSSIWSFATFFSAFIWTTVMSVKQETPLTFSTTSLVPWDGGNCVQATWLALKHHVPQRCLYLPFDGRVDPCKVLLRVKPGVVSPSIVPTWKQGDRGGSGITGSSTGRGKRGDRKRWRGRGIGLSRILPFNLLKLS